MISRNRPARAAVVSLPALLAALAACSPPASSSGGSGATTGASGGPAGGARASDAGRSGTNAGTAGDAGADAASGGGAADGGGSRAPNVLPVTVNGALCLDAKYTNINEPCTEVTVCEPGTQKCQTIGGILVDTGSTGLRLFASTVKLRLDPVPSGDGTLAECESFSGGMSSWGSLAQADVVLGGEPAVRTPIFLIDSHFGKPTGACDPATSTLDTSPEDSGFNGILGISHHPDDCGSACKTDPQNGTYYRCTSAGCSPTTTDVQLQNPVGLLPLDGNGEILALPPVPPEGAPSIAGSLILGIGTRPNNTPGKVVVLPTADFGTVLPQFGAAPIQSGTIDSGSSKLYFPAIPDIPICTPPGGGPAPATGLLCPRPSKTLTATMVSGATRAPVTFTVDDADALRASPNSVFPGYAEAVSPTDPYFMWGLPFFFGRSVYVAIDGKSTVLGPGPYWAY